MKTLLGLTAGALLALGAPVAAPAASITYTDSAAPGHVCLSTSAPQACNGGVGSVASTTFTFDITDSGFALGSLITSAEIVLDLADDGGSGDASEKISLTLDGTPVTYTDNANHDAVITLSDFSLLSDGKIVVVLGASQGDYFFDGARLTVVDDPTPGGPAAAAVPAPAALAVLGAGALLTAWRRRAAR